jgi:uncharacterized protein YbjT (DUF2867 family)
MILVCGAGGNVGRELVRELSHSGVPFRAGFHSAERAEAARRSGIEAVGMEYSDPGSVRASLDGVEAVFLASPARPELPDREGVVVEEARKAGIRRLVKLSVWRASEESFEFARWNRAAEKQIESGPFAWTHLRPNSFHQNFILLHADAIRGEGAIRLPVGRGKVSGIDTRDVGAVAARVLAEPGHEGHAYDLSGPDSMGYAQAAGILSVVLGRPVRCVDVSEEEYRGRMLGTGVPGWLVDALIAWFRYVREGNAADVLGSVRAILGRAPIPFEGFARDHADAFR